MMKMWKKIIAMTILSIVLTVPTIVHATENSQTEGTVVFDDAGLMYDEEITALTMQITNLENRTGWDIFAVTTADAQGKTAMEYADDFYDERTAESADGFLVLIDMDNREIYISTQGKVIRYLTDERIERVIDAGYSYISNGEYAGGLSAMIGKAEYYYDEGILKEQYNYDVDTGSISAYHALTWMEILPIFLLAAGVGLAIFIGVKKSYSLKGGRYEYPYMKYGKMKLTEQEDRFIRAHTTHHRIQTDSGRSGGSHHSGSGRSSTHRSSSGRSHGGGGRKF